MDSVVAALCECQMTGAMRNQMSVRRHGQRHTSVSNPYFILDQYSKIYHMMKLEPFRISDSIRPCTPYVFSLLLLLPHSPRARYRNINLSHLPSRHMLTCTCKTGPRPFSYPASTATLPTSSTKSPWMFVGCVLVRVMDRAATISCYSAASDRFQCDARKSNSPPGGFWGSLRGLPSGRRP